MTGVSLPIFPTVLSTGMRTPPARPVWTATLSVRKARRSIPHDSADTCGSDGEGCWDGRSDCLGCHRYDPALGGPTELVHSSGGSSARAPTGGLALSQQQLALAQGLSARIVAGIMAEAARPAPGLPRLVWAIVFFTVIPLALLAFVNHLEQADIPTLVQGPLVVDPALGDRLAAVLPTDFIRWSQLAIHIAGFVTFAGLAALIAFRSQETVSLVASAMLVAVGASLFAPLAGLGGVPGRVAGLVGEVAPGRTPGLWISISGILLIGFLLMATTGDLGKVAGGLLLGLAVVGLVSTISPGWLLDPARLTPPWRQIWTVGVPAGVLFTAWWRLRNQTPGHRRQIRPVLVALALILAAYLVLVLLRPDLRADAFGLVLATPRLQALYEINSLMLMTGAVFALPFSIVLAVVRYRLFDIDLLVNRALVYGAMTAVITLVFLGVTIVTAAAAGGILGQGVTRHAGRTGCCHRRGDNRHGGGGGSSAAASAAAEVGRPLFLSREVRCRASPRRFCDAADRRLRCRGPQGRSR